MKEDSADHEKSQDLPGQKKAVRALQIRSSTDFELVVLEYRHTPRHLTES